MFLRTLKIVLVCIACACNGGCIGSMILSGGQSFDFDEQTTSEKLRKEFGPPLEVDRFQPPVAISEISHFDNVRSFSLSNTIETPLVTYLETYGYVGPVSIDDQTWGMFFAMETTWSLLTLGIAEFYYIPMAIDMKRGYSNAERVFVVAFSESGQYVAYKMISSNHH